MNTEYTVHFSCVSPSDPDPLKSGTSRIGWMWSGSSPELCDFDIITTDGGTKLVNMIQDSRSQYRSTEARLTWSYPQWYPNFTDYAHDITCVIDLSQAVHTGHGVWSATGGQSPPHAMANGEPTEKPHVVNMAVAFACIRSCSLSSFQAHWQGWV